jgi:MoxR-like ATPase
LGFPYYSRSVKDIQSGTGQGLPSPWRTRLGGPQSYDPDQGLVNAMNVALILGQPLLLTGEPGTGKTDFAKSVSWQLLGVDEKGMPRKPLVFEAKSTSTARELFYSFDTLGRFHQAREGSVRNIDYLTYNALGQAILLANRNDAVQEWLSPLQFEFLHDGPRRSVVLIDEIDKAPRDFPNDVLNELENMYFRVPELGNKVLSAPPEMQPIVIITNNSEKSLPDPFLRRCVYYNIPFPDRERMAAILDRRLRDSKQAKSAYIGEALDLFFSFRDSRVAWRKKPATAELLGWLIYLGDRITDKGRPLRDNREILQSSMGALVKSAEDQASAAEILNDWLNPTKAGQG